MTGCLLEQILSTREALSVRFQPIVFIHNGVKRIDSYEALVRGPRGTHFEQANLLFDYVRRKHAENVVDRRCITVICNAVKDLPVDWRININVHAATLEQNDSTADFFGRQIRSLGLHPDRFTLEIVEHSPAHNVPALISNIKALRSMGVRIALDDIGLGNSNYAMILDCRPDYFKLDAFFVRGVSHDRDRAAVVKSLMFLAKKMKGMVVAEGANTTEDISKLAQLGVQYFQCNLLCPPLTAEDLLTRGPNLFPAGSCAPSERKDKVFVPPAMLENQCSSWAVAPTCGRSDIAKD